MSKSERPRAEPRRHTTRVATTTNNVVTRIEDALIGRDRWSSSGLISEKIVLWLRPCSAGYTRSRHQHKARRLDRGNRGAWHGQMLENQVIVTGALFVMWYYLLIGWHFINYSCVNPAGKAFLHIKRSNWTLAMFCYKYCCSKCTSCTSECASASLMKLHTPLSRQQSGQDIPSTARTGQRYKVNSMIHKIAAAALNSYPHIPQPSSVSSSNST